ncbi:SPOR domain-containing protein [Yoonia sp. 2307UL14-13]
MTGINLDNTGIWGRSLLLVAGLALASCDENGEFALPGGDDEDSTTAAASSGTTVRTTTGEEDVERPDIFEVTDRGLWDGRPSLGGTWVAHPDVREPERALIRNTATGETVVGALFRRERENPGPLLQISSDAAEELGVLPGAPTELYVVALRREETVTETSEENPVVADLAAPVNVETTALDGAADTATDAAAETASAATATVATAAIGTAAAAADAATPDRVEVNLPPAEPTEEPADTAILATPAAASANLDGPQLQIGVFSVQANADAAADRLRAANIPTSVVAQEVGGRTVWRVVSSPAESADADTTLTRIKDLGFVDSFLVETDS